MTDEIRVRGINYPRASHRAPKKTSVGLFRLRSFAWVLVIGALVWGVMIYGTPHLRFAYTYRPIGEARFYTRCDYIGWNSQRIAPRDGRCPLFLFLRKPHQK